MPRKPKDEVAATTTITLRLTPDDRERIERLVELRGPELPERSMSALLRRLVREAEDLTTVRLPADERALLDRLVVARGEELARLGVYEASATPSSVMVGLIREAARSKGLDAPSPPPTPEAGAQPASVEPPHRAPKPPAGLDPANVKAALVAAIEGGARQSEIARQAGLDSGQLSRFKASGSGLSADSLARLSKAVGMNA
ncbi:MAG: hypothetical protein R3B70_20670 [Polyangiaceae bacterium]